MNFSLYKPKDKCKLFRTDNINKNYCLGKLGIIHKVLSVLPANYY